MFLDAAGLLASLDAELLALRAQLTVTPGLALLWVGDDAETGKFVRAKQKMAKDLNCSFALHQFPNTSARQLSAVISSLNAKKDVHGIVVQLPLPKTISTDAILNSISPAKDIDGLTSAAAMAAPTPTGIIELLKHNKIDLTQKTTAILGNGRLVGAPLAKLFKNNNWDFFQIDRQAKERAAEIQQADIIIAATGVPGLVTPAMVKKTTIVVDASGVDVPVKEIEPLVAKITPAKGAIGPLTVRYLFKNLLLGALQSTQKS